MMDNKYKEYLKSDEWKNIRELVLERDSHKCILCDSNKNLNIHHKNYKHIYDEINNLECLITLCNKCHAKFHDLATESEKDININKSKVIKVDDYLKISKDLVGCKITLQRSNEIAFMLEVCRIKQEEILNSNSDKYNPVSIINKRDISNAITKDSMKNNNRLCTLESKEIYFENKKGLEVLIIKYIKLDQKSGDFTIEFDINNFIEYFINIDSNFVKVPTTLFRGLKSKNASMMLLWMFKFQDVRGYRFISRDDLIFMLNHNYNENRRDNLKRCVVNSLEQLVHLGIIKTVDGKVVVDFDRNKNLKLPIIPFKVNGKIKNKIYE